MFKWLVGFTAVGVLILSGDYPLPRSYSDWAWLAAGYLLMLGPGILLFFMFFNRLINISFDINYTDKKK